MGTGPRPLVRPAGALVELPNEAEEAVFGGLQVGRQFGDLLAHSLEGYELMDSRRFGGSDFVGKHVRSIGVREIEVKKITTG